MLRLSYLQISFVGVAPDFAVKIALRPRSTLEGRPINETTPRDRHYWVINMCCNQKVAPDHQRKCLSWLWSLGIFLSSWQRFAVTPQ